MKTPLDGYKTYILLATGLAAMIIRSRFGVEIPEEVIWGIFTGAGLTLRQAVARKE